MLATNTPSNQTVIRYPALFPNHNQTLVRAPFGWSNHNQTVVRR
jgi:hypothetical protein